MAAAAAPSSSPDVDASPLSTSLSPPVAVSTTAAAAAAGATPAAASASVPDALAALEARLAHLESRVGSLSGSGAAAAGADSIRARIAAVRATLQADERKYHNGRKHYEQMMPYLTGEQVADGLPAVTKRAILQGTAVDVAASVTEAKQIDALEQTINPDILADIGTLQAVAASVSAKTTQEAAAVAVLRAQSDLMLKAYENMMDTVNKKLSSWNKTLDVMESRVAAAQKPAQ